MSSVACRHVAKHDIAYRLRRLADDMDAIAVLMDYYGGFAEWSRHGTEMAGAGNIARQWALEIDMDGDTER